MYIYVSIFVLTKGNRENKLLSRIIIKRTEKRTDVFVVHVKCHMERDVFSQNDCKRSNMEYVLS